MHKDCCFSYEFEYSGVLSISSRLVFLRKVGCVRGGDLILPKRVEKVLGRGHSSFRAGVAGLQRCDILETNTTLSCQGSSWPPTDLGKLCAH